MTDVYRRLRYQVSGLHIRDVPVCRNLRPSSARHSVSKPYEYHQSDIPGSVESEVTGRNSERLGQEACRRPEGILWRASIALYNQVLYILNNGPQHWHGIALGLDSHIPSSNVIVILR